MSSLIFVALAVAWLFVLVPMFARRRQRIARTTDSALAARVVRRGGTRRPATGTRGNDRVEEAFAMPDADRHETDVDSTDVEDEQRQQVHSDDARAGRRYRPGRGGFDPEAAALAARTKYARRQRIVLVVLLAAVVTAVIAALAWPVLWWLHVLVDLGLVGYLVYLRRQVRIEEDIRSRRLARLSGDSEEGDASEEGYEPESDEYADHESEEYSAGVGELGEDDPTTQAVMVDIDEDDPMFDELDERTWRPYRRASGE